MTSLYLKRLLFFPAVVMCLAATPLQAQESEEGEVRIEETQPSNEAVVNDINDRVSLWEPGVEPSQISSLFFTAGEFSLIQEARAGFTAGTGQVEALSDFQPPMGPREVLLSGIVYVSSGDWTLWLNGVRVTPEAIPSEVMDLKVFKEHIDLKWFDAYTNQVFPIRLRAHQRFNLDTRIFLPG